MILNRGSHIALTALTLLLVMVQLYRSTVA
jgi:hypothetical protein